MKKSKYVVLYIRVSTDKQVKDGMSIDAQTSILIKYCEDNNLHNYIVLNDAGISGTKSNRPALNKALELIEDDCVSDLIYVKSDRLC